MQSIKATAENIDNLVSRYFKPGQKVTLHLGIPRELTMEELTQYSDSLKANGAVLLSNVESGETGLYRHAIQVEIAAPNYEGVGLLPLAVLLVLALGVVGIAAYTGVTIVNSVSKNIVPIMVIGATSLILVALVMSKRPSSSEVQWGSAKAGYKTA